MDAPTVEVRPGYRRPWAEEIQFQKGDPRMFADGFLDLGVDAERVQRFVERYREAERVVTSIYSVPAPRFYAGKDGIGTFFENRRLQVQRVWEGAVADVFRDHEFLIEDSVRRQVDVPLFHLNSAPVERSRTVYEEIVTTQTSESWSVTVFGSGMGATQSLKVTYATKLQSTDGHPKLVFVPVPVVVYLMGVYEHGKRIGGGLRTEVAELEGESWQPGVRSEPASALLPMPPHAEVLRERFQLAADTSGNIQTYRHSVKAGVEFEFRAGIEAFDQGVNSKVKIKQEREVKLTFDLPAGHDYEALSVAGVSGVWWKVG